MKMHWNKASKLMTAAGLVLAMAAGSMAQAEAPAPTPPKPPKAAKRKMEGSFNQPLTATAPAHGGHNESSNYTLIQQDGDNQLKLVVKNGDIQAEINGKPVPEDRIKREGDEVRVLDENGEAVGGPITIGGHGGGNNRMLFRALGGEHAFPGLGVTGTMEDPPVMLGVTMSDADEKVLDVLGISADDGAIQIDSVRDELPAAKGGLKEKDLIVAINGQTPATQAKLREILKTGKPGDELKLKVMRRGQAQELTIKLEAFDATKLGRTGVEPMWAPSDPLNGGVWSLNGNRQAMDAARAELEAALKALQNEAANIDTKQLREEASKAMEKALEAMKEKGNGLYRYYTSTPSPSAPQGMGAPGMVFSVPGGEATARVQELEGRLDRMEKTLDTILKKLDEKK